MAHEYIDHGIISPKADIFSLGVIIIEIITGRRDYPNIRERTETSLKHYADEVRLFSMHGNFYFTSANVYF
jgi:serine/threonine protein kinase